MVRIDCQDTTRDWLAMSNDTGWIGIESKETKGKSFNASHMSNFIALQSHSD